MRAVFVAKGVVDYIQHMRLTGTGATDNNNLDYLGHLISLNGCVRPDGLDECQGSSVVVVFRHDHWEWRIAWRGDQP